MNRLCESRRIEQPGVWNGVVFEFAISGQTQLTGIHQPTFLYSSEHDAFK